MFHSRPTTPTPVINTSTKTLPPLEKIDPSIQRTPSPRKDSPSSTISPYEQLESPLSDNENDDLTEPLLHGMQDSEEQKMVEHESIQKEELQKQNQAQVLSALASLRVTLSYSRNPSVTEYLNNQCKNTITLLIQKANLLLNRDLQNTIVNDELSKQLEQVSASLSRNQEIIKGVFFTTTLRDYRHFDYFSSTRFALDIQKQIIEFNHLIDKHALALTNHKAEIAPSKWNPLPVQDPRKNVITQLIDLFKNYYAPSERKMHINRNHTNLAVTLVYHLEQNALKNQSLETQLKNATQYIADMKNHMIIHGMTKGSLPWTQYFGGSTFFNYLNKAEKMLQTATLDLEENLESRSDIRFNSRAS